MAKFQPKTKAQLQELIIDESVYLGDIDTSAIVDMSCLFGRYRDDTKIIRIDFSGIEKWNVSNVADMSYMFSDCKTFNVNISAWDVSSVTNMENMFENCYIFNQPLNAWNVSKVENTSGMFGGCYAFNQPLNSWNVSKVKNMNGMFFDCYVFNQALDSWNVSNVTDMDSMFGHCYTFNQPLGNWNVSKVTNMNAMFSGCHTFNQSLDNWNVSKVTSMDNMFENCHRFNQSLNSWNVGKVTNMYSMFEYCCSFNQSLANWDIGKVTKTDYMFAHCQSLNQDFSSWIFSGRVSKDEMFEDTFMEKKSEYMPQKPKKAKESYMNFKHTSELEISFEGPRKALKYLCYALSDKNIVTMWHNQKCFYESGELKSIAFIDYLNEEKGQKYRNVYEFSKERDLLSFESICGDVSSKVTDINYTKSKVSGKIELANKDDFIRVKEFFELLKCDDNALAMMYQNDNLTKNKLLKGKYSVYTGDSDESGDEARSNSYLCLEYDEFGVLKGFCVDDSVQEDNPSTTSCNIGENGYMEELQLDWDVWGGNYHQNGMEDLLKCEINGDTALVEMREFNKDKLKSIFGEYICDKKGDIKGFENKDFKLKEVFLKYAFDLCGDENDEYEELADEMVEKDEDEYELCGYKLIDEVDDDFSFCGAYISKMMSFEVPVKYLSRIEKVMIEKSVIYQDGEIAIAKPILMF